MTKQYISYYDGTSKEANVVELATRTRAGLMSKEDKAKLDSIIIKENEEPIQANTIVEDTFHRFVTDVEKTRWNTKADRTLATEDSAGLMSPEDKAKLDNIDGSTISSYTHPETHPATMIVEDTFHRFVTDVEKTRWNTNAEKAIATTESPGLMSPEDKVKLDSIPTGYDVNFDDEEKAVSIVAVL